MKISACYIAKNEAANLARSINSLKAQVDEIVVVDTGSEDSTVTAAKSLGARVYHYSWQDDFAAARNFALAKTTG
ncbi:MAG: glycosyltransferase, partial [Anaerovibrio sp.]|nr:glycosyltransferase [Anaerovibrio sp.]